jgi:predicted small lipoprotein YifL
LGLLDACGQKGPLVLPGHAKDTPWPLPPSAAGTPAAPVTAPTPVAVPAPADTQPAGAGNGAAPAPPLNGP